MKYIIGGCLFLILVMVPFTYGVESEISDFSIFIEPLDSYNTEVVLAGSEGYIISSSQEVLFYSSLYKEDLAMMTSSGIVELPSNTLLGGLGDFNAIEGLATLESFEKEIEADNLAGMTLVLNSLSGDASIIIFSSYAEELKSYNEGLENKNSLIEISKNVNKRSLFNAPNLEGSFTGTIIFLVLGLLLGVVLGYFLGRNNPKKKKKKR